MPKASPTLISPRRINSSSRKNGPSCARSSSSVRRIWRRTSRVAILAPSERSRGEIMAVSTADKRATFRKMHESGCFVLPNPFDVGSARALQHLGFKALASTSAGFAWAIGKADNRVTLDEVCAHLTDICAAVDLPVNADFEGGFAIEPAQVGANVARAVKTGVAG